MSKCKICGARLEDGVAVCSSCGAKVISSSAGAAGTNMGIGASAGITNSRVSSPSQTVKTTCPSCGAEIVGEHRFCPQCGVSLEEYEDDIEQQIMPESSPEETYATENSYALSPAEQARIDADNWRNKCEHHVTGGWCLKYAGLYHRSAFDVGAIFLGIIGVAMGKGFSSLLFLLLGLGNLLFPLIDFFVVGKNIFGLVTKFADKNTLCKLGYRYYYGAGISQSHSKALEHFRLAADKGNVTAKYNLGYMYYHGHGVAQDYKKAAEYFQQAMSAT